MIVGEINPLYKVGDVVKIKDLETLKAELGEEIDAQCGWVDSMDKFAGSVCEVVDVFLSKRRGLHYSYRFKETGYWVFSEDTLEPEQTSADGHMYDATAMSYEEVMNIP